MSVEPGLKDVLDALPDAAAFLGSDGRIVRANRVLHALLGSEPSGRTILELTRDEATAEVVSKAIAGTSGRCELFLPISRRTLLVNAHPLSEGALVIAHDVTHAKQLEVARRDFVANASHELRTPVTAIRGGAETLLSGAIDQPAIARATVEIISRHAERLAQLTQELLDLSRIESGEWCLAVSALDVAECAGHSLELLRDRADAKRILLETELAEGLSLMGDVRAMEQVLVNLLDNAVKYTPAGGRVKVASVAVDDEVEISVSDSGPGIDRQHLARVFERFYRVDKGRSRDAGGTGLGLSIVKHLVEAQQGTVGVESDRSGSRFWVRLPRARKRVGG